MSDVNPNFESNAMPNDYFRHQEEYSNDKLLYDSLVTEAYNKNGVPMYYYTTTYDITKDAIFGEDNTRTVERKFKFMAHHELQMELERFSSFGIEGLDNFHIYCSQSHISAASTYGMDALSGTPDTYDVYTPTEGDILYSVFNAQWYEIINVDREAEQFLQSKNHTWDFFVKSLADEHMTISDALSGDIIVQRMNITPDVFSVSGAVDEEKSDYLFDGSDEDEQPDDVFSGW